jgi:hypothetical protein
MRSIVAARAVVSFRGIVIIGTFWFVVSRLSPIVAIVAIVLIDTLGTVVAVVAEFTILAVVTIDHIVVSIPIVVIVPIVAVVVFVAIDHIFVFVVIVTHGRILSDGVNGLFASGEENGIIGRHRLIHMIRKSVLNRHIRLDRQHDVTIQTSVKNVRIPKNVPNVPDGRIELIAKTGRDDATLTILQDETGVIHVAILKDGANGLVVTGEENVITVTHDIPVTSRISVNNGLTGLDQYSALTIRPTVIIVIKQKNVPDVPDGGIELIGITVRDHTILTIGITVRFARFMKVCITVRTCIKLSKLGSRIIHHTGVIQIGDFSRSKVIFVQHVTILIIGCRVSGVGCRTRPDNR